MKKNITINMFGSLYAIDEDAYELLNQYQDNMRRYFSRQEGGEEIAEDIERRVAELFAELKATGVEAITIELVQDIISRIGNPEQVDGQEEGNGSSIDENPAKEENKGNMRKKLFRNPDDKMLGGVCSGLSCYFGIDALWLRLLTVLLAWFSVGTMIVVYLILWVVIPEACTPEDRLRMQGRPVNMENLRDEIMGNIRKAGQYAAQPETRRTAKGCLGKLLKVLLVLLLAGLFLFGIGGAVLYIFYFCANYIGHMSAVALHGTSAAFHISQNIYWVILASFTVLVSLTLYLVVRLFARLSGRTRPLSAPKRTALVVLWLAAAVTFFVSAIRGGIRYNYDETRRRMEQQTRRDSTFIHEQTDFLAEGGWTVVRHKNCGDRYVKSGEYYTGMREKQYIDTWSHDHGMEYEVEKTEKVAPGVYRLTAMARTDGHGCDIFARSGGKELLSAVPPYGNTGGGLWQEARKMSEAPADTTRDATLKLPGQWQSILDANDGKGFGWSRVAVGGITVGQDGTVTYGVTNARSGAWDGTWFSATDFRLEKVSAPATPRKTKPHPSKPVSQQAI